MNKARKITEPTGKPVKMIPPTGGSTLQPTSRDYENDPWQPDERSSLIPSKPFVERPRPIT